MIPALVVLGTIATQAARLQKTLSAPDVVVECAADAREGIITCALGTRWGVEERKPAAVRIYAGSPPKLIARKQLDTDGFPDQIEYRNLLGGTTRQVVITWAIGGRNPYVEVYRPKGRAIETLAQVTAYWGFIPVDLDGDGVFEIVRLLRPAQRLCDGNHHRSRALRRQALRTG